VARVLAYGALVALALVVQLAVLNLLPLPGGVTPDLVLLVVVAIALISGPMTGLVTGFAAGLGLDLAPPASHAIGAYALVFCLIGYLCGRAAGEIDRSAFLPLTAMALGAAGGTVLYTVVGVMFGEPGVTWAAARNVLPLSVAYDVLLSPFVLYLVLRITRLAGRAAEDPAVALARAGPPAVAAAARGGTAKRQPREPRLRPGTGRAAGRIQGTAAGLLPASGRSAQPWAGGAGGHAGPGGRQSSLPRLRFGDTRQAGTSRGARPAPLPRLRFGPTRRTDATAVWPARPPRLRLRPSRSPGAMADRKPGVFSGGSLVGGSQVRLRFGAGRASWLLSRTERVLGLGLHGHQPARPKFTGARSAAMPFGAGRSGAGATGASRAGIGRPGTRRFRFARSGSGLMGSRRPGRGLSGARLTGHLRPPRRGSLRPGAPRSGAPRFNAPRSGWMRPSGLGTRSRRSWPSGLGTTSRRGWPSGLGSRRGWLAGLRPRRGWPASRRTGGRRTGGLR
jgi:rod shape-determining protein MreD